MSSGVFVVPDGMPKSIFENKYSRKIEGERFQSWAERLYEVVEGNYSLVPIVDSKKKEQTHSLARQGVMAFAGRHLQHGDLDQRKKTGEKFTNCSTAMTSFQKFWLLTQGSGVGRLYDSDLCRVNWDFMPHVRFVLSQTHPDWEQWIETTEDAKHRYDSESEMVRWFTVGDSAEGWAKVIEILETASFQKTHAEKLFIFDLSEVRDSGSPIRGQQNRPASGPVPFIRALVEVSRIKGAGMPPWLQALHIDHRLSECVLLGGIRRSARIAAKNWRDHDVIDFINIKRGGFLWSANNSVVVDEEFWKQAESPAPSHARRVYDAMLSAGFFDNTGEPGFLNAHKMSWEPMDKMALREADITEGSWADKMHPRTKEMINKIFQYAIRKPYPYIVNPCGEIVLAAYGGYCVIGDICMANATSDEELVAAAERMVEFLMRTNTMGFMYQFEVDRTNRIGVGLTGVFEYAWDKFGLNFHDLVHGHDSAARPFWDLIDRMRNAAIAAAERYAKELNVEVPHTILTMKPSGTISKVMNVTEAAHLPAMAFYLRWVQFVMSDPQYLALRERGYPWKDISSQYKNTHVIGYPTCLPLVRRMGDKVVTMNDVTPQEQYQWLRLLEKHWLGEEGKGNQISYTLKYDPDKMSFEEFKTIVLTNQPTVRACSMMPQIDQSAYIYVPEETISAERFAEIEAGIDAVDKEEYDDQQLLCEGGACPIEFDIN